MKNTNHNLTNPRFHALLSDGSIIEWYEPTTFSAVFKHFKDDCNIFDCKGILYCKDIPIRKTGKAEIKPMFFPESMGFVDYFNTEYNRI